ncbi:MAG: redoxin domain-containing protein [Chthonomonadaceae bacterium]|nr:redoxin domain-containing protein [Chthonomonadaceae bacterium]
MNQLFVLLMLGSLGTPLLPVLQENKTQTKSEAAINVTAPLFTLKDVDGKSRALASFRGRPVVLFVFCGCEDCKPVAEKWARLQQLGAVKAITQKRKTPGKEPLTLIAYVGDTLQTREFGIKSKFDPNETILLPDPTLEVGQKYEAMPCPRVFVLDEKGVVRYTNKTKSAKDEKLSPDVLISHTLNALLEVKPVPSTPPPGTNLSFQKPTAKPGELMLTVLPADGLITPEKSAGTYELRGVDTKKLPKIVRTFSFKNETKKVITVDRVQTSCGCESVMMTQKGVEIKQPRLSPGDSMDLRLTVNIASHPGGQKVAYAWLYSVESPTALATLQIRADILRNGSAVSTSQPIIETGENLSGKTTTTAKTGDHLQALTERLFFGSVSPGNETPRRIVLTAPTLASFDDLRVIGAPAWLQLSFQKPTTSGSGKPICVVEAKLKSSVPSGTLHLKISFTNGKDTVEVPVIGTIERQ